MHVIRIKLLCYYKYNFRLNTKACLQLLCYLGLFVNKLEKWLMHTEHVWQGKLVYGYIINKRQFVIKVCTYRLGEACSCVAVVISCLIEATQHQE